MAKVPNIRFKGFSDEWKEASLSEYLTVSTERNENDQYTAHDILSVSGEYGVVNQIEFQGRSFAGASLLNYRVIHHGEVAYTKSPLKQSPYGIIKANKSVTGIVSALYGVYKKKKGDPNFIQDYFDLLSRLNNYLRPLVNKGAKNTLLITDEDAISGKVVFPKENEQKKISAFISHLSATISQREKELQKLKNIKRALLERMFPQDGQNTPSIRFKGFTGEWSNVPFGKLIIEDKEVSTVENEDILLSSAIEGMFLNSELFGHQRGQSNIGYRKVTKGMLILSAQNLHLGNANVNLRFDHGIVSPAYKTYHIQGADTEFMAVWVKREETKAFFDKATTAGASMCRKNINWDDLYQQDLVMPLNNEQKKIGKFILTLDKLIILRKKYIEQMKHTKQALLEQMFVNE